MKVWIEIVMAISVVLFTVIFIWASVKQIKGSLKELRDLQEKNRRVNT